MGSTTRTVTVDGIPYHTIFDAPRSTCLPREGQLSLGHGLILLSHALMANNSMWDFTVTTLTGAGYSCLRFDHVGHGGTSLPSSLRPPPLDKSGPFIQPPQLHFDEIARHMRDLVHATTGQSKVKAVIGCSMGGVLALRFAMLVPESLEPDGYVIACDPPGATSLEEAKPKWSKRIEQFARDEAQGTELLRHATVERWIPFPAGRDASNDPETAVARETALQMVRSCSFHGYRLCADGIRQYDYEGELGKVKVRTMVLVGELDEAVGPRSVTEGIADRIGGAEYVWMPDAGHLPPLHRPREFEDRILQVLHSR